MSEDIHRSETSQDVIRKRLFVEAEGDVAADERVPVLLHSQAAVN